MPEEIAIPAANATILEEKKTAWSKFGGLVYQTEISLQYKAANAIADITQPVSIEDVPAAEALLKRLKAAKTDVTMERKTITAKMDDLGTRLMAHEKSFDGPIKDLEANIVRLKKEYEKEQQYIAAKDNERKQCIELLRNTAASAEANWKTLINNKVDGAYKYALGEYNLQPIDKDAYINKCCENVNENTFPVPKLRHDYRLLSSAEVTALEDEYFKFDRSNFVAMYAVQLESRFSDFEVAYQNKAEALKQAELQRKQQEDETRAQLSQQQLANKLEAVAETITQPEIFTKGLKKSYEIDMPETVESVLAIMGAFAANIHLCLPKLRVAKWFDMKPSQVGAALAKVKCDDNNFQPSGIRFKEVDKL